MPQESVFAGPPQSSDYQRRTVLPLEEKVKGAVKEINSRISLSSIKNRDLL